MYKRVSHCATQKMPEELNNKMTTSDVVSTLQHFWKSLCYRLTTHIAVVYPREVTGGGTVDTGYSRQGSTKQPQQKYFMTNDHKREFDNIC